MNRPVPGLGLAAARPASFVSLALFALSALTSARASAQDLFGVPGNPRLVASGLSVPDGATLLGEDAAGYVYYAQGGLACHHRDDPATAYYLPEQSFFDANGTRTNAYVAGLITPDGSGIEVAFVPFGGQTRPLEALRLFRVSCADLKPGGAGATALGGTILRSDDPLLDNLRAADFVRLDSGALCFAANPPSGAAFASHAPSPYGIVCIDPATSPPTVTQLVDSADLDGALDVDPGLAAGPSFLPLERQSWSLSALAAARDGRIFFIASRSYQWGEGSAVNASHGYVVERRADGTLALHFGPASLTSWGPLSGASQLVYSADLDAMLTRVVDQEHNWAAYADLVDTGFAGPTWGWTGVGLRVFPLDAPGSGYIPLSHAVAQRHGCTTLIPYCGQLSQLRLLAHGDETLLTVTRLSGNPNLPNFEIDALALDEAELDLDDDGLSAAREAAAGTWDTVADSDRGGSPDGLEVDFAKSDPLDADAEPARLAGVRGSLRYVPSPLIAKHLGGVSGDDVRSERPRTVGGDNPLCVGGRCFGPDGALVATYPVDKKLGGTSPVIAADGSFIMLHTAAGLERYYFADAREELAVSAADLDAYVPVWSPDALHVLPLDATRTIIACDGAVDPERFPAIVALADGAAIRVLYDHAQAQRDSGLTVATLDSFEPNDAGVMASISIIGWNADTQRLHLGVRGNWDSWLIALGLDGQATIIGRGRALEGMNQPGPISYTMSLAPPPLPDYLLPTGHGDYFASGGVMEPFGGYLPGHSTTISNMDLPPLAIWGDVLLDTVCCGFDQDGFYELVRYDERVSPGDVLVVRHLDGTSPGVMLFKSGPRGGLAELWHAPLRDVGDVGGIDLAPDGSLRLCIADRSHDVVWELEPAGPGGVPEIIRYTADVPGIRDCAYDADGSLRVLAIGPARVEVRAGDFGDLAVAETLPSAPAPIELVRKPDGSNEVRVKDGLRGKAYLPDGRVVTMRDDDMVLRVDDVPLAAGDFGARLVYQSANIDYGPTHPARVALALRPDGLVVVAPFDGEMRPPYALIGRVMLVGQRADDYSGPLAVGDYFAHEGLGLTVVPGGSNADPWTGRAPPVVEPPGAPSIAAARDAGDPAASADDPAASADAAAGCGAGATPDVLLAGLGALAALALRRRRPPAAAPRAGRGAARCR
ncbi:MAG: hypothetical protein U1F43_05560 [Myxococcota bacterium]